MEAQLERRRKATTLDAGSFRLTCPGPAKSTGSLESPQHLPGIWEIHNSSWNRLELEPLPACGPQRQGGSTRPRRIFQFVLTGETDATSEANPAAGITVVMPWTQSVKK